jgi:TRAP-type C4-dicarboxylate transport system permease large subunit
VISKNAMKFIGAEIAVLLVVTYIEPISMWLPKLLGF